MRTSFGTSSSASISNFYDVTRSGADPTGATDSRTALQTVLSTANSAGGGIVYFPPGTYNCTVNPNFWNTTIKNQFGQTIAANAGFLLDVTGYRNIEIWLAPNAWIQIADNQQTGSPSSGTIVHGLVGTDVQKFSIFGSGKGSCGIRGNKAGQTGWTGGHAQQQHGCMIFFQSITAGAGNGVNYITLADFSTGDCWSNSSNMFGTNVDPPENGHITVKNVDGYDFGEGIQFGGFTDVHCTDVSHTINYDREVQFETLGTCTITIASPAVVTFASHGLQTGKPLRFTTTGALPTGLSTGTTYFAILVNSSTFRVATTVQNAYDAVPINTSGTQSGTHTYKKLGILVNGGDGLEFSAVDNSTIVSPSFRGQVGGSEIDVFGCKNLTITGAAWKDSSLPISIDDGNASRTSDNIVLNGVVIDGVVGTGILIGASGKIDAANVDISNCQTPYQILNGTVSGGANSKPVNLFNVSTNKCKGAVSINTGRRVNVVGGVDDSTAASAWDITSTVNLNMVGRRIITTGGQCFNAASAWTGLITGCDFQSAGANVLRTNTPAFTGIRFTGNKVNAAATNTWAVIGLYERLVFNASVDQTSLTGVILTGELHTLDIPSLDQEIELRFTGTVTVVNNSAATGAINKFLLAGGVNAVMTTRSRMVVVFDGTNWIENGRSVN